MGCKCECGVSPKTVKQGDEYYLACTIYMNGVAMSASHVPLLDKLEYCFEDANPREVKAEDSWNGILGVFLLPVSQQETLLLEEGKNKLDLRVKFVGGNVFGARHRRNVRILEANSMEVI
jgi:hypothetical protein